MVRRKEHSRENIDPRESSQGGNEIVREEQKRADQLGEAIVRKMEAEKELGTTGLLYTESMIDCAIHGLRQSDAINLIKGQLRALEEDDFRSFYLGRTCELTCDITLSDGNVIDGECTIDNIISGEVTIHLNGSSGIFTISRSLFEDLINDDAIVPL
ncbi:hypothetical protein PRIPAC_85285 [Pristionchus pacificus]|uniref:Uncharacterized protein n=1 Tax=Pristionchus pacificus TaxID=54126 RepID=A0A2A6CCL3_PRIPA|nr:hypothetical protein PRIPAC_85285 [Pristionchus pacificus]|eukprot:PDM75751.1 hypothetical protein PRIPAC_40130 [Pristionchus pacificus]